MVATNPGTTNLISWWKFDEASGDAVDSHGSNTLTETSGTIASVAGKVGNGRQTVIADSEYFGIADNASLSFADEDMTLGFWWKPDSLPASVQYLFGKWLVSAGEREWVVGIDNGVDQYSVMFRASADGSTTTNVLSAITMSTGNWYFIIAWHDKTANTINISVNNEAPVNQAYSSGLKDRTGQFRIGCSASSTGYVSATFDEAFIYRRLLTADEREWLWNSGNGRTYNDLTAVSTKNYYYQQQQ